MTRKNLTKFAQFLMAFWSIAIPSSAFPRTEESRVYVGPNVQVSRDNGTHEHAEVYIDADPINAKHLVVCAIVDFQGTEPYSGKVVAYASADGGKSWRPTIKLANNW